MTQEEKARAYDEALERAKKVQKKFHSGDAIFALMNDIFPQLHESEDERIRKSLIELVEQFMADERKEKTLSWLKKQKEQMHADISSLRDWKFIVDAVLTEHEGIGQYLDKPETERIAKKLQERFSLPQSKPAEWSEEDEKFFITALWHISYSVSNGKSTDCRCDTTEWLKSIKERIKSLRPQPKQEWSKEDEDFINMLILHFNYLIDKGGDSVETYKSYKEKLKSLLSS